MFEMFSNSQIQPTAMDPINKQVVSPSPNNLTRVATK